MDDKELYAQYLAETNPEEAKLYQEYLDSQKSTWDHVKDAGGTALDYGTRALDYAGGVTRTGIADMLSDSDKVTGDDYLKALKGKAPGSSEYLERMGVDKLGSLSEALPSMYSDSGNGMFTFQKGGPLDITGRGAAGFALDTLADPLTYATMGTSAALKNAGKAAKAGKLAKVNRIVNPAETLSKWGGKKIYKSGLKRVDQEVAKYGKKPVSDLLYEHGIAGTATNIGNKMDDLADKLKFEADKIIMEAKNQGAKVSMKDAMAPTRARIKAIRASGDPKIQPLAKKLEAQVKSYQKLDARAARQKVSFTEPKVVEGSLPSQATHVPSRSEVTINPPGWETNSLPVSNKRSGLDIGESIQVPPQMTIQPTNRIVPGKTIPESFIQKMEEPFSYVEPRRTIPGEMVPGLAGVTPGTATGFKQSIRHDIPQGAFAESISKKKPMRIKAEKEMASGLQTAVERSVQKTTGRGTELKDINDKLGRLLTSADKQKMEGFKEANKNLWTSVDAPLAVLSPVAWAAKKGADIMKMSGPRTHLGRGMQDVGRNARGSMDTLLRRWAIDNQGGADGNQQ